MKTSSLWTFRRRSVGLAVLLVPLLAASAGADCPRFVSMSEGLPTTREWRTHPALGDVNGDGRPDVAALPRKGLGPGIWISETSRGWREASSGLSLPGFSCGVGVDLADVNGDGHLDLGVADHCRGLFVFLGDGSGAWKRIAGPPLSEFGQEDLAFGDLNGDGHPDLVAVGSQHGGLSLLLGDGRGAFRRADSGLPWGRGTDVKVADVDRDGSLDIAAAFVAADPGPALRATHRRFPVLWLNDGTGRFRAASEGLPDDGNFRGVALGDLNGDGALDLAISGGAWSGRPPLLIYLHEAPGRWAPASGGHPAAPPDVVYEGVELADLDLDGRLDLVAVRHRDAGIDVWRGDGKGGFAACEQTGLPRGRTELRGWGLAVGDLDGDGKVDLAAGFGRDNRGSLEVWVQR